MTFGEKIRAAREALGYSQRDMADKIPMNQSNYSKIERNMQEPSMAQLRRLCQILQLDPRLLLDLPCEVSRDPRYGNLLAELVALVDRHTEAPSGGEDPNG